MCSKTFIYLRIHSAFQNMQAAHLICTYAPHTSEMLAFELNADNTLEGLPPLQPGGHSVHDFQQECQIWTRLTIRTLFHFEQSILNEPWPSGHDGASGPGLHMASFLHDRALVGICRWHGGFVFTDSGFWKYSWAHLVMSMTESCQ